MPSKFIKERPQPDTPHMLKVAIPIITALLVALLTASGATLYRHELAIMSVARNLEKLQIKDYRQQRDNLRKQVEFHGDSYTTLEAVIENDPEAFGPNGRLILRQRKEDHEEAKERLENYVEENKHYGEG